LGDSIPHWAGVQAKATGKPNLKLPEGKTIGWWGIRGMRWDQLRRTIETNVLLSKQPAIVFIHLGGNDITSDTAARIRNKVQREMRYLRVAVPEAVLVWIDVLQRIAWGSSKYSDTICEAKRIRLNRYGRQLAKLHPKHDFLEVDIDIKTKGFYRQDGVHLSVVGIEFYLDAIRDIILKHA
jgi:lysophospholipase L1-like esterase